MYINFQQNRVSRAVKTVHTSLQKSSNYINLHLSIKILKNHAFRTCTTPSRTLKPIWRSIALLDIEIPRKEIISTIGKTTIGSFFRKKKKLLKNGNLKKIKTISYQNILQNAPNCTI